MRKSKPTTVVLSMAEYEKLQEKEMQWKNKIEPKARKEMTLEELNKDTYFDEHVGSMENVYPGLSSVEIAKKWTDYVD